MSILDRRPALRWLAPLLAVVLLTTAGSAVGLITAAARGGLPTRTARQLLVDVQQARLDAFSGTIVETANLGLPALPGSGGSGSSKFSSLLAGSHTLRLWYDGPNRMRLALLGSLGESDVIRNGTNLWTWSSNGKRATRRTVPASGPSLPQTLVSALPVTPQQAAQTALKAIGPTTKVGTDGTAVVAGRPAYEIVLRPLDGRSLIGAVRIAVDGATRVPTRVQVFSRASDVPAFEVGFTSFDPTRPDPSVFRFTPPPGGKVTPQRNGHASGAERSEESHRLRPRDGNEPAQVVGSGWTSVVVARVPPGAVNGQAALADTLQALPEVDGAWGSGRLLQGALFSALLTDDGRLAVGAVPPRLLYAAVDG